MLSEEIVERLQHGYIVAAELPTAEADMRAYLMVMARVPKPFKRADYDYAKSRGGIFHLKNPPSIDGYEIRYVKHHASFTETDYGWDYDVAVADAATRVKRVFVNSLDEIAAALAKWQVAPEALKGARNFDSALVNNDVAVYLDKIDKYPHLWLD